MKKILSVFAAAAILFGFASCNGDLHDVDNSPFGGTSSSVFIIGGIGKASVDKSQYISEGTLDASSTGFEVPVNNGNFSLEFTYTGEDSWGASAGSQAFTIVERVTSWNDTGTRWGAGSVAVGGEGTITTEDTSNINLTGLEAGTKYTLKGSLTAAKGTLTLEKGLSGVGMDIINVKDGLMKDAFSATPSATGEKYKYTYKVNAAEAGELNFVVRVGVNVWVPSEKADIAKKSVKVATPIRFDQVAKIDYPITFAYDAWEYGYELSFEYDTTTNALTVSSVKLSSMYIYASCSGWAWKGMEPGENNWTYNFAGVSEIQIAGMNSDRTWDGCYRNGIGEDPVEFEGNKEYSFATTAKGGIEKNLKLTGFDSSKEYKITLTKAEEGKASIVITLVGDVPKYDVTINVSKANGFEDNTVIVLKNFAIGGATVDGSLFGWCKGSPVILDAEGPFEINATCTEYGSWVATECDKPIPAGYAAFKDATTNAFYVFELGKTTTIEF